MLHARRGDADPWPALDEALAIAVAANELDTIGPVAIARAEARWLAGEADLVAEETDDALARAERSDHRWMIGELAMLAPPRAACRMPAASGCRRPTGRSSRGDVRAAAEFWTRSRMPLRRRARARLQ